MSPDNDRLGRRTVIAVAVIALMGLHVPPAFADCAQADRNAGECRQIGGTTSDTEVTIRVDVTTPGSSGSGGSTGSSTSAGATSTGGSTVTPPPSRTRPASPPPLRLPVLGSSECQVVVAGMCRGSSPAKNPPPPSSPSSPTTPPALITTPPTPPRSVSELGEFTPDRPGLAIQPGEWSMPRLPTNFVANASTHRQSGELVGWPIQVRFIPHRFHWSFGDGNRATFSDAGRTWAALGLRQFDPTPTSHVYQRPGTYQVSVRVEYRAEFRFVGESWQRLSGTVSSTSHGTRVRVLTVSPLLLGD